ncbi:CvpA family protein [Anaeromicropila populeti]|nr:CvpA family protein [Anaeromicropila populeti]
MEFIVLAILASYILMGLKEGFIKTVFSFCSIFIALIITQIVSGPISTQVRGNGVVVNYISSQVEELFSLEKISVEDVEKEGKDEKAGTVSSQVNIINSLTLPESIKESLIENNNTEVYRAMEVDNFGEYINRFLTYAIINCITYSIVFGIVMLALQIIASMLNIVSKLPVVHSINKAGGAAVGAVRGFAIIWVMCIVLTIFSSTETGKIIFNQINSSAFLSFIYNNNLLAKTVINVTKSLF